MIEVQITGSVGVIKTNVSMVPPLTVEQAAFIVGASPSDIPGLWFADGYPELTTYQLLGLAQKRMPPA